MSDERSSRIFWDDLRVTANMITVSGSQYSESPEYVTIIHNAERGPSYSGLFGYRFGYGRGMFQSGHFQVQLPHGYVPGSPIEPHVHVRLDPVSGAAAGQKLLLEFEYVWVNIHQPRPRSTTILGLNHTVTEEDLGSDNLMISFGLIEKKDAGISSILDCRFSRLNFDPDWEKDFWTPQGLTNDDFRGYLVFKEFDFHYQLDSPGSRERLHR
jgi:hypothetical protein